MTAGHKLRSFGMSAYNNVQVGETDNNIVKSDFQFLQTLQVGETAPTLKLAESQLRITCKLAGPNIVELDPQFLQTMQVGGASNSEAGEKSASMNIIKKLGNKMLPNFIFKIINPI
ncbi:Nitrogen regulation protein nifr3 [Staphylococcus aureus]|nr:Nitrogen regulation protein nifr3 [Staphylococcus aureus]